MGLIFKLANMLNMMKDIEVGHSTSNDHAFLLYYKDKAYKVTLEEFEPNENPVEDFKHLERR